MIKLKLKISGTETEYEGEMEFLENTILPLLKEDRKLSNENLKIKLLSPLRKVGGAVKKIINSKY